MRLTVCLLTSPARRASPIYPLHASGQLSYQAAQGHAGLQVQAFHPRRNCGSLSATGCTRIATRSASATPPHWRATAPQRAC